MPVRLKIAEATSPLSNKTGPRFTDVAYPTNIFGKQKAAVLKPKIDKISITYPIDKPHDKKGINRNLRSAAQDTSSPEYQWGNLYDKKLRGYGTNVHLRHAASGERILIQADPWKKKNKFLRFEFNPTKLGKAGMEFFRGELTGLMGGWFSYSDIITQGDITRLDIACDFVGVTMNDILVRSTEEKITMAYMGKSGNLESVYPSKPAPDAPSPNKVYDKKEEQKYKTYKPEYGEIPHLRAEVSIQTDIKVPDLHKLKNHFKKLDIIARAAVTPPEEEHHWRFFFDSCSVRGVEGALDQLPKKLREPYRTALEDAGKAFWQPDKIWKHWPKEFQKSCLLDGL